jgi:hypothetical protein
MTQLTDRYLAAAVRGIPNAQRTDVERELRSSISDAIEDRAAAGEDRPSAERAVLEGLGDPVRLAAGLAGRPLHLIGPELFVEYRQLLTLLLTVVMPIVGIVQAAIALGSGDDLVGAAVAGIGGAWTVGVHIFFWVTLTFAIVERVDAARDAKEEISGAGGRWTVDRLPALPADRISASDTVGEVLGNVLSIAGLLFVNGVAWFTDGSGATIPFFNPDMRGVLIPALVALLASIGGLRIVVFLVGRWTMPLATASAVLHAAFAIPVIALALAGSLINPAFADALGWPPLADPRGVVVLSLAGGVLAVTAWEIIDPFRRARRADARASAIGERGEVAR